MRFVMPETTKLTLPDGNWIEVKKELTVGEEHAYRMAGLRRVQGVDGKPALEIDWLTAKRARVVAYLIDWSARDAQDKPVKVTPAAIETLATEDFDAIDAAIEAHIEAGLEKKVPTTMPTSSEASPS